MTNEHKINYNQERRKLRHLPTSCWFLLLTLSIVHVSYVEANNQAGAECMVRYHGELLNCSRRNFLEFPDVGPDVHRNHVKMLLLEGNRISKIGSLTGYDILEELYFSNNSLRYLENGTFRGVMNLRKLDLQWNMLFAIEAGAFSGLKNLEEIDLNHNKISFLLDGVFAGLHMLKYLNLRSNPLIERSISKDSFRNLISLRTIDMSETLLTNLPNELFKNCVNLHTVVFRKTLLVSVNMIYWPSAPYKKVDLRYSPLVNITNVPQEITILRASLGELLCTCENERALLLILNGRLNITSHCQNLRCNGLPESGATVVAPQHLPSESFSLDAPCATSESASIQTNKQLYLLPIGCGIFALLTGL